MSTARWSTYLGSYLEAVKSLNQAVKFVDTQQPNDLAKQGFIHTFEFTHELAMALLQAYVNKRKLYLDAEGATREAGYLGLINVESGWMKMLEARRMLLEVIMGMFWRDLTGI